MNRGWPPAGMPRRAADHPADRQPGEQRIPAAENQGLPEAPEAAIAISKGVNEFQLVVGHAAHEQGMPCAGG